MMVGEAFPVVTVSVAEVLVSGVVPQESVTVA
jgi:hypothetical protein